MQGCIGQQESRKNRSQKERFRLQKNNRYEGVAGRLR